MKNLKTYPGKLEKIKLWLTSIKLSPRIIFILMGVGSTIWFLVRVLPKPQRAAYPCMKAAAPLMSGFVIYVISLGGSAILFKQAFSKFKQAKYMSAILALFVCLVFVAIFNINDVKNAFANTFSTPTWTFPGVLPDAPNTPMGVGQGIFPGRVIWAWNPTAVNQNCPNTSISNCFFMGVNNNIDTINIMLDNSIKKLAGQTTVKDAWDSIFYYFNKKKTGVASGYTTGQTIFIKVNNGQAGWNIDTATLTEPSYSSPISETTPATVLAVLRQLIDTCKIPQNKIYVAEPMTHLYDHMYNYLHNVYPSVNYLDKENHTSVGRTTSAGWTTNSAITYSDKGTIMQDAISDELMLEMYNADYLINIAALKAHARNGVSLCAKLHFGSHGYHSSYGWGSFDLHKGLICTNQNNDDFSSGVRGDYHMYRVLVDFMSHKKLGRNTLLFVVDGLWGGTEATEAGCKWQSSPFYNTWPSSIFTSLDPVAIESVCLDFLRAEAKVNTLFKNRPLFPAVDDYLHQAADSANWPKGIKYDPNNDGTLVASLGVHEHWNNATDKQYTRNLNNTGLGIELVKAEPYIQSVSINSVQLKTNFKLYPNPCTAASNATMAFQLKSKSSIIINLISMDGKIVQNIRQEELTPGLHEKNINTANLKSGMYICVLKSTTNGVTQTTVAKLEVK